MNVIEQLWRESIPMPDRRTIGEWGAQHVNFGNTTAFKGRYSVENTPWMREVQRAWQDRRCRQIDFIGPPQISGKSTNSELLMAWTICNEPCPMAYNTVNGGKADTFSDTRVERIFAATPELRKRLHPNPHKKTKNKIVWRDATFLLIQGAESEPNRQSDSIERQINDEVNLWERPWLSEMMKRTDAYADTRKVLNTSVGGTTNSEQHEQWMAGSQGEWAIPCPHCAKLFVPDVNWKQPEKSTVKFDMAAVKITSAGNFDFEEFDKGVHCECPHCKGRIEYNSDELALANRSGGALHANPSALPEHVSLRVNAFTIGRTSWAKLLHPWVKAVMGKSVHSKVEQAQFVRMVLSNFWEETPTVVHKNVPKGNYTRAEMRSPRSAWNDEWIRVMGVDFQHGSKGEGEHMFYVCRALSRDGRSRLVDAGRVQTWEQLRKRQIELGVPDSTRDRPGPWVLVDTGYNPQKVNEVCARYKWFGADGMDSPHFVHGPNSEFAGLRMYFSEQKNIDLGYGTAEAGRAFAAQFQWSSQSVQSILAELRAGRAQEWTVPMDIDQFCPEYGEQINSHHQIFKEEHRRLKLAERTGKPVNQLGRLEGDELVWARIGSTPDHLYDCESMICVIGLMAGVFKS